MGKNKSWSSKPLPTSPSLGRQVQPKTAAGSQLCCWPPQDSTAWQGQEPCSCSNTTHTQLAAFSTRCCLVCTFASVASSPSSPSLLASASVGICPTTFQIGVGGVLPVLQQISLAFLKRISFPQLWGERSVGRSRILQTKAIPILPRATPLWPSTSLYHQLLHHVPDLLCIVQPSSRER